MEGSTLSKSMKSVFHLKTGKQPPKQIVPDTVKLFCAQFLLHYQRTYFLKGLNVLRNLSQFQESNHELEWF